MAAPHRFRLWTRLALVLLALTLACHPRAANGPAERAHGKPGVEITLYRNHAVVGHRLEVKIPAAAPATIRLRIAAGVDPESLYLVEKSELTVREVRLLGTQKLPTPEGCDEVSCVLDNYERACCEKYERKPSEWEDEKPPDNKPLVIAPVDVEVVVSGPREGTYSMLLGYETPRLAWDAAYTMTTPPAHDRVQLRGAIAIRNATGITFSDARVQVIDTVHSQAAQRVVEPKRPADPNATPIPSPRELGRITLVEGDTRVELLADAAPRPMRSVMVFDPIGPGLDYQHKAPVQDPNLGVSPPPATRVTESFEIDRVPATRNLPGGPVRLLERRADGSLVLLGETTLFGAGTLAAAVDTVAVGTATLVTGTRERRELTIDSDRKRIVEEFALTIDNARERPIDVVLREHLYRGEEWSIAYRSVLDIAKEGKQQIAMRAAVPAHGKQTVLYVVVYSWDK